MQNLNELTIPQLNALVKDLTHERLEIRKKALAVQAVLSKKIESAKVSKLLGRNVQVLDVKGIESEEVVKGM